jgi:hypothetical protein
VNWIRRFSWARHKAVARRYPCLLVVTLVNFTGLSSPQRWDEAHPAPTSSNDVSIKIERTRRPARVFWDCPEDAHGPRSLGFDYSEGILIIEIPQISLMGLVAIYD